MGFNERALFNLFYNFIIAALLRVFLILSGNLWGFLPFVVCNRCFHSIQKKSKNTDLSAAPKAKLSLKYLNKDLFKLKISKITENGQRAFPVTSKKGDVSGE